MAYKVIMYTEAAKGFRKLDSGIQKRIAALVAKIAGLLLAAAAFHLFKK